MASDPQSILSWTETHQPGGETLSITLTPEEYSGLKRDAERYRFFRQAYIRGAGNLTTLIRALPVGDAVDEGKFDSAFDLSMHKPVRG